MSLLKVFSEMGYDVNDAFDKFGCDTVYEGKAVWVCPGARVKGLGTELVRRSIQVGEKAGCQYSYLYATGEYSSKVFKKLNFTLDKEVLYETISMDNGEEMLKDVREHKTGRIFYKKLTPIGY